MFEAFSWQHGGFLAMGFFAMGFLLWYVGRDAVRRVRISRGLALLCWGAYPMSCVGWWLSSREVGLENWLPLQLCDVTSVVAGFALWFGGARCREVFYGWGLLGAGQALVTPALSGVGRWELPVWVFFLNHLVLYAGVLWMVRVERWRLPVGGLFVSWWRVMGWSQVYLGGVLLVNGLLDTNFGFVSRKPEVASVLDWLGPWPEYLLGMEVVAAVGFFLLLWMIRGKGEVRLAPV